MSAEILDIFQRRVTPPENGHGWDVGGVQINSVELFRITSALAGTVDRHRQDLIVGIRNQCAFASAVAVSTGSGIATIVAQEDDEYIIPKEPFSQKRQELNIAAQSLLRAVLLTDTIKTGNAAVNLFRQIRRDRNVQIVHVSCLIEEPWKLAGAKDRGENPWTARANLEKEGISVSSLVRYSADTGYASGVSTILRQAPRLSRLPSSSDPTPV